MFSRWLSLCLRARFSFRILLNSNGWSSSLIIVSSLSRLLDNDLVLASTCFCKITNSSLIPSISANNSRLSPLQSQLSNPLPSPAAITCCLPLSVTSGTDGRLFDQCEQPLATDVSVSQESKMESSNKAPDWQPCPSVARGPLPPDCNAIEFYRSESASSIGFWASLRWIKLTSCSFNKGPSFPWKARFDCFPRYHVIVNLLLSLLKVFVAPPGDDHFPCCWIVSSTNFFKVSKLLVQTRVGEFELCSNSPTPFGELAYVGDFDHHHRRVFYSS